MKFLPSERSTACLALALATLSACGDSSQAADTGVVRAVETAPRIVSEGGFPLEILLADGSTLELTEPPRSVLPANAGIVDFLSVLIEPDRFAALPKAAEAYSRLGAGSAAGAEFHGVPTFQTYTAEVVLALEPDLVLSNAWQSPETSAVLRDLDVPVLISSVPRTWDEVLESLAFLAEVVGEADRGRSFAAELERRRAALRSSAHFGRGLRALSYTNFGAGGTTAGSGTTADVIFALAGLENAAAEAGIDGHGGIDHERLLALDPDVILVGAGDDPDGYPHAEDYLRSQAELADLSAVRADRIVALPSKLFSTTSFELLTAAEALLAALDGTPSR